MRASIGCLLALVWLTGAASAQEGETKKSAPNPDKGATLAQRWCASCHVVSRTQSRGADLTPSFESIAQRGDFNADKLAFFLLNPHPVMPNMALTRDEARDIAAFIATQRR